MKFTAYIKKHIMPLTYWNATAEGVEDGNSPNPNTAYTVAGSYVGDGTTRLTFERAPNFPPIETGDHFVITYPNGVDELIYAGGLVSSGASENSWNYFDVGVELPQAPPSGTQYMRIRFGGDVGFSTDNTYMWDLRKQISNIVFTSSIDYGFDTATLTLNESASSLGRDFTNILGGNIEIADTYGRVCWSGIVTNIYLDGGGGRIDAVGYKHTFEWFRFDNAYLREGGSWPADDPGSIYWPTGSGPTSVDLLLDAMRANPYINIRNYGRVDMQNGAGDTFRAQQLFGTLGNGLDELDFSDGSYKAMDAIRTVESFGFYGAESAGFFGASSSFSNDTIYLQCWRNGFCIIKRVINDPDIFDPEIIIPRSAVSKDYSGVEISGDISDIVTEQYLVYNDDVSGESIISASSYNLPLIYKYGIRTKVTASSQPNPQLAATVASVARSDHALVTGVGNVRIIDNLKGVNGQQRNISPYMIKAGMTAQFEENIGFSSLYKNRSGVPGIFYIGSTSYDTSTNVLTISPARIMSAVDLLVTRLSDIQN